MKVNQLAVIAATAMAFGGGIGFAPVALAQKGMDNIKAMDTDKDGMISKAEFMKMMGEYYDKMDTAKKGKLTAEDVAKSIKEIAATYGTAG